ncbi:hypothetical protein IAR55_003921 [Kwoniella newhampshirensis]|uniref:Transmembrane protein n=1 Tax=Kwoniella newhampshirensis TaxID=1651941 RepID=A0AAW0YXR7_9TREE
MNITLDDSSPQFDWSPTGSWTTLHSADLSRGLYLQETYHSTSVDGASFTFRFNGSAVHVYGARRSNHGTYSVQLDDGDILYTMGHDEPDRFQTLLYTAGGLTTDVEHVITLSNQPSKTVSLPNTTTTWDLDIDYVVITYPVTGSLYTSRYDDVASAFVYSGQDWQHGANVDATGSYNGTNASTGTIGDAVTFSFSGSSIQLFGAFDQDRGDYSVILDGGSSQRFNGTTTEFSAETTLYMASNLADGPHTLHLTNLGGSGSMLNIDYAVLNSSYPPVLANYRGIVVLNNSVPANPLTWTARTESNRTAAIAGGVTGGVVLLAVAAILMWFCLYPRRGSSTEGLERGPVDLIENEEKGKSYQVDPFPSAVVQEQWRSSMERDVTDREGELARTLSVGTSVRFPSSPTQSHDRLISPSVSSPNRRTYSYAESTNSSTCCGCERHSHPFAGSDPFRPTSPVLNNWSKYPIHHHHFGHSSQNLAYQSHTHHEYDLCHASCPALDSAPPSPPFRTNPIYIPGSYPYLARSRSGSFSRTSPSSPMSPSSGRRKSVLGREIDAGPVSPTMESENENSQDHSVDEQAEGTGRGGMLPPDYEQATENMLEGRGRDVKSV